MKGLITICARGGSVGVPKKNIQIINNIPLIAYSINMAEKFAIQYNCDIALSTDSSEIKTVAENQGLVTNYVRPSYLSTNEVGKIQVIKDILLFTEKESSIQYDYILDLDVSSPLRTLEDLIEAFKIFMGDLNCLNLFSVSRANKNPYFNMVEKNKNGYFSLCKNIGVVNSRQSAPPVYELNASFYFFKRNYFNSCSLHVINSKSLIYELPHICFDIDEQIDLDFFQFLVENSKLDFTL